MERQDDNVFEKPEPGLETFYLEFIEDRKSELEDLKKHLNDENFEAIQKLAHKWKGFAKPYGFGKLATISESIEQISIPCSKSVYSDIFDSIESYLNEKSQYSF